MKIIKEICNGIPDPTTLAKQGHYNFRISVEEIAKALVSNELEDY